MRLVFTGGGTGGHIFPNIGIIRELRAAAKRPEFFYIGEKSSLEEKLIKEEGVAFAGIHAGKFRRYFDVKNFVDMLKIPLGFFEAIWHLRRIRPDLVFAKGGYVSVPVCLAARVLKIPVWLHESDLSPGLSTKIISRFAKKIFLSFEESRQFFPDKNTHTLSVVGNPIRKEMTEGEAKRGYALTGFSEKLPVILVIGGSTGAVRLNQIIYKILPELLKKAQVVHLTGSHSSSHPALPSSLNSHYRSFSFLGRELADCYAISSLAISRAGSGSLFELLANAIPMLLIPLPLAGSRGDQIENAGSFERQGFARALSEDTLTPELFLNSIEQMLHAQKSVPMSHRGAILFNAAGKIAKEIIAYDSSSADF